MRDEYDEITDRGGEIVAIGTGNVGYAKAFVDEEHVPFPVLVDDDGRAAKAASIPSMNFFKLVLNRNSRAAMRRAREGGSRHPQGRAPGDAARRDVRRRPGRPVVRYEHVDVDSSDHAPVDEVIAAVPEPAAN